MRDWELNAAIRAKQVDYRQMVSIPIRDMWRDGEIVFVVDIYGWTVKDVCVIPGGSDPLIAAVKRIGLDPDRYQAVLWDVMAA